MAKDSEALIALRDEFAELERRMGEAASSSKPEEIAQLAKRHRELSKILAAADALVEARALLADAEEMRFEEDPELVAIAETEEWEAKAEVERLAGELNALLRPRDPVDDADVVLEIRAGAGGDEAALFAADLLRMYTRLAEERGWRVERMSASETGLGGFKEVIVEITGRGVHGDLKFESGTHRVQRIPRTESGGRIHTSTATVAVLPEEDEAIKIEVRDDDLKVDVFRSSGAGGQHVNVTDSAVRLTHEPTGIVITCQDERSQHQNRAKAMRVLRARLLDRERAARSDARAAQRRGQVGTGDRSEKIRTYNVPQNRVTDHRIGLTVHGVDRVLAGELDEVIGALRGAAQSEQTP